MLIVVAIRKGIDSAMGTCEVWTFAVYVYQTVQGRRNLMRKVRTHFLA